VSLLTATRPTGNRVDMTQAKKDAQKLVDAGVGKRGTDEIKFVTILCTRRYAFLFGILNASFLFFPFDLFLF